MRLVLVLLVFSSIVKFWFVILRMLLVCFIWCCSWVLNVWVIVLLGLCVGLGGVISLNLIYSSDVSLFWC